LTCPGTTPCSGHGTCNVTIGLCTCSNGYTGADCSTPPPLTCPGTTPCSGHGTCNSTTGLCACSTGYGTASCVDCAPNYSGYPNCQLLQPDVLLYRFRSTTADQGHKFLPTTSPTDGFTIENSGNPVLRVFSYNPGYLTKLLQCARSTDRDYILTLEGSPEHLTLPGLGFACYDNSWWTLNENETRYPNYSNIPVCLRGRRSGSDNDHLFTLNAAELSSLITEDSGFRIWAP
jgi:hypothetical protein